jgi:rRNA maturation RNase YbeY
MILNRQKKIHLSPNALQMFLREIQRELKLEDAEVTIAFVSDAEIARWNLSFRKKKGPTDVLSFPVASTGAHRKKSDTILGDIAISPETARRYAKKNARTLQQELRVLMLHGVLHLLGFDHESKSDYGQMDRIEQRLRRRLGIA